MTLKKKGRTFQNNGNNYIIFLTVKSSLLLFVIFSVYIFDPASPRPVAVQAAVSRKTDIIAAAFYPTSLVRGSTEGHSTKMSKLYFLTAKQVNASFFEFFFGSLYLAGKLPTYPSPKARLTLTSHLGQNVGLGEG